MEGVDEEGRTVVCEGDADHSEDVSVVEIEQVRALPVECHHLVVRGALGHRLYEYLLVLLRTVTLNPSSEHSSKGAFMCHSRKTHPLSLNLTEAKTKTVEYV